MPGTPNIKKNMLEKRTVPKSRKAITPVDILEEAERRTTGSSALKLKKNPTLLDLQQYVAELEAERGFDKNTVLEKYLLLSEEIGELAKCIRKQASTMRTDANKNYSFDTAGEFGDILILLCALANRLEVDLEQAFRDKEEINKKRKWA